MKEVNIQANEWHPREDLEEVIQFITESTLDRYSGWRWVNNTNCKYVSLRFDMRDGAFIIQDRTGKRISFEELKKQ